LSGKEFQDGAAVANARLAIRVYVF